MKNVARALVAASVLLAADAARAAPRWDAGGPDNAFRLELGGSTLSSPGIYCPGGGAGCYYSGSPFAWDALYIGGDVDVALGQGLLNLTFGARELAAPYYTGDPNIFEPAIGLTFKFLRHTNVSPRLAIGAGFLIGNEGSTGAALRLGGGVSFFARGQVGLAVDLMFEAGHFGGYGVSQLQFALGPEFHF